MAHRIKPASARRKTGFVATSRSVIICEMTASCRELPRLNCRGRDPQAAVPTILFTFQLPPLIHANRGPKFVLSEMNATGPANIE